MILIPGRQDFVIHKGTSFGPFQILFEESAGVPFDLTPYTSVTAKLRQTPDTLSAALTLTATIAAPATSGIVVISATLTEVNSLTIGDYVWDVLLGRSDGGVDGPFLEGAITVKNAVSR